MKLWHRSLHCLQCILDNVYPYIHRCYKYSASGAAVKEVT